MAIINAEQVVMQSLNNYIASNQQKMIDRVTEYYSQEFPDAPSEKVLAVGDVFSFTNLNTSILEFSYSNINKDTTPIIGFEETVNNSNNDANVTVTVAYTKTLEETFSFRFNEAVEISTSVTVSAGLPLIGEAEVEVSGSFSLGSEQEWTTTETRTWQVNEAVVVAAGKSAQIAGVINNGKINSQFTAKLIPNNTTKIDIYINTEIPNGGGWGAACGMPISVLFTDDELENEIGAIPLSGVFNGIEGIGTDIIIT